MKLILVAIALCVALISIDSSHGYRVHGPLRSLRMMADYSIPARLSSTANYKESEAKSRSFGAIKRRNQGSKTVAIIGGGLSGLSCAKYLSDAGHKPLVLEARNVLGGKVSAWQDEDGDWIETGLHIFFGAYPNMMNLFKELKIEDRLQWKEHQMTFAMQDLPGKFTSFNFIPNVPAPFNMALAILGNNEMLTLQEKILMVPALLPMLTEGQSFIDAQDELSVTEFMNKYGMPSRVNDEIFIAMGKALDFIDPEKLSMTVVLTAMNRFINEADGSQTAFLDGNAPDRLCAPMAQHIEKRGGEVRTNSPVAEIMTTDEGTITGLRLKDGSIVQADEYVSAMPVDIFRRLMPESWSTMPYFAQIDELEGIPVINIQIWFDKKLDSVDGLCFSRSPLLSVYADMSTTCKEYGNSEGSMLELVFAPCTPQAAKDGTGAQNWMGKTNEEIIDATMIELARLFPDEIGANYKDPSYAKAKMKKYSVVRTPRSVYAAYPGRNKYRPSQATPVPNFTLAGDWSSQKFLGSMEGAILGGKLAAEVISAKTIAESTDMSISSDLKMKFRNIAMDVKEIQQGVIDKASQMQPRKPRGLINSEDAIAYGGGSQQISKSILSEVSDSNSDHSDSGLNSSSRNAGSPPRANVSVGARSSSSKGIYTQGGQTGGSKNVSKNGPVKAKLGWVLDDMLSPSA